MSDRDLLSPPPSHPADRGATDGDVAPDIHGCLPHLCSLQKNAIGARGARKIADALKQNCSLKELT